MILTKQQHKEFEQVVEPVIKWLNDNCHPHVEITIDSVRAELFEGITTTVTQKFIKD